MSHSVPVPLVSVSGPPSPVTGSGAGGWRGVPMSDSFDFSTPDLFTAGAIGPPGQRVFYLQAREGDTLVTLKCEKEQVRVLGEYLGRLLERLSAPAPASGADLALVEPLTPAWIVGSIGVGYDEATDRVVLVIEEVREQEEAETEESERGGRAGGPRGGRARVRAGGRDEEAAADEATGRPGASASLGSRWRRSWSGRAASSRAGAPRAGSAAGR